MDIQTALATLGSIGEDILTVTYDHSMTMPEISYAQGLPDALIVSELAELSTYELITCDDQRYGPSELGCAVVSVLLEDQARYAERIEG